MNINWESKEWQTVTVPKNTRLIGGGSVGSFDKIKLQVICRDAEFYSGRVERHTTKLPGAQGYHHLDGREITVKKKERELFRLRVEDAGLGSAKADAFIQLLGFKF